MLTYIIFIAISVTLWACGNGGSAPVPRRTAYPRVYLYDSVYIAVPGAPVFTMVNRDAVVESCRNADGSVWLNVKYPRYDAVIYCTYTPVNATNLAAVADNRLERIRLNIGSVPYESIAIDSKGGYVSVLSVSPSAMPTPLQFISSAADDPRWLLSGSVFFERSVSDATADSVAPMIDVIERDIKVLLGSLTDTAL